MHRDELLSDAAALVGSERYRQVQVGIMFVRRKVPCSAYCLPGVGSHRKRSEDMVLRSQLALGEPHKNRLLQALTAGDTHRRVAQRRSQFVELTNQFDSETGGG